MNRFSEILVDLFAFSGCLWLLFLIYESVRIRLFIVKRYEEETKLRETRYFKEQLTFIGYCPAFIRSAMYTFHLLSFAWGWNLIKKIKKKVSYYDDIESPEYVTHNFSRKEIRQVMFCTLSELVLVLHAITYLAFKFTLPEVFN